MKSKYCFLNEGITTHLIKKLSTTTYNQKDQLKDKIIIKFIDELINCKNLHEAIEIYNIKSNHYLLKKFHSEHLHNIYNILCTYDEYNFRDKLQLYKQMI